MWSLCPETGPFVEMALYWSNISTVSLRTKNQELVHTSGSTSIVLYHSRILFVIMRFMKTPWDYYCFTLSSLLKKAFSHTSVFWRTTDYMSTVTATQRRSKRLVFKVEQHTTVAYYTPRDNTAHSHKRTLSTRDLCTMKDKIKDELRWRHNNHELHTSS